MPFNKSQNMSKLRLCLRFCCCVRIKVDALRNTESLTLSKISRKLCIVLCRKIIAITAANNCTCDLIFHFIPIDSALMLRNINYTFGMVY